MVSIADYRHLNAYGASVDRFRVQSHCSIDGLWDRSYVHAGNSDCCSAWARAVYDDSWGHDCACQENKEWILLLIHDEIKILPMIANARIRYGTGHGTTQKLRWRWW